MGDTSGIDLGRCRLLPIMIEANILVVCSPPLPQFGYHCIQLLLMLIQHVFDIDSVLVIAPKRCSSTVYTQQIVLQIDLGG